MRRTQPSARANSAPSHSSAGALHHPPDMLTIQHVQARMYVHKCMCVLMYISIQAPAAVPTDLGKTRLTKDGCVTHSNKGVMDSSPCNAMLCAKLVNDQAGKHQHSTHTQTPVTSCCQCVWASHPAGCCCCPRCHQVVKTRVIVHTSHNQLGCQSWSCMTAC